METLTNLRKLNPQQFVYATRQIIEKMTEVTGDHLLTPELRLHLVTPKCPLWRGDFKTCPFTDPYWAFYWPGGEGLTRFVLDNKNITEGKHVLDIGSGCGSLAITAAKLGLADSVTANDIDPIAAIAIELNASLNGVQPNTIKIVTNNIIGNKFLTKYDCVLLGDMFYSEDFSNSLIHWLLRSLNEEVNVFIGDPGRHRKFYQEYKQFVDKVGEYEVSEDYVKVNELETRFITIWKMSCR